MPTAARRSTTETDSSDRGAGTTTVEDVTTTAKAATEEAAATTGGTGSGVLRSVRQVITMPATVAREVADDVVTTVRRPDAVLYFGGLVGLAALGVLEWPVAAAAGVGVAVASGVRRART